MISEGTSIPRIRTVLILRDIKSPVKFEQTVHRGTRNRSNEFPQDAKVIFFHLPEMIIFAGTIEEEIKLVVPAEKPRCPQCQNTLEFRPRSGRPCSFCGYEPEPTDEPRKSGIGFEWLFSEFGGESVLQGGDDFSLYDPISRTVLGKLGENPHYGARHGLNEVLKTAHQGGLIALQESETTTNQAPFSDEEVQDRYWNQGRKNCEKVAGVISRKERTDYQETLRGIIWECKRTARMGKDKQETVKRDYMDPTGTFRRFYEASQQALERARRRYGQ